MKQNKQSLLDTISVCLFRHPSVTEITIALEQSKAVPVVSTSMEEFEYNRFYLFYLTGSKVSFFPALLTFGPSNSCAEKKKLHNMYGKVLTESRL